MSATFLADLDWHHRLHRDPRSSAIGHSALVVRCRSVSAPRLTPDNGLVLEEPRPSDYRLRAGKRRAFEPRTSSMRSMRGPIESPVAPPEVAPAFVPGTEGERGLLVALLTEAIKDLARPPSRGDAEAVRAAEQDRESARCFLFQDSSTLDLACAAGGLDVEALREQLRRRIRSRERP